MSDEPISTGIDGLVWPAAETPSHTELVTVAVNPPPVATAAAPMPPNWNMHRTAAFVRDVALNMYDLPVILKTHGLTQEQYDGFKEHPVFKSTLEAMIVDWHGPQSTNKRLALEAAIAIEDALPTVMARVSKPNEPLTGIVALLQLLTKLAGLGDQGDRTAPGEKFKITINLGSDTFQQEKTSAPRSLVEVQSLPEGVSHAATLQSLLSAPGSPATL